MGDTVLINRSILIPGMKQTVLARSLNETLYFFEKLIQHHFSDAVEHSLPDTGYQSSHLRIRAVFEHCLPVALLQVYSYIALHKTRSTGPLAAENVMRRCLLLLDGNLSFVSSFNGSDANLHGCFVLIRSNFVQVVAAWHALRHDLRIEQHLPNFLPGGVKCIASFYFQRADLRFVERRVTTLKPCRAVAPICGYAR
jgi:hypothetical protein